MTEIETFNLNEDIHQYDDNVANLEMGNLAKVSRPMIGLISTPLGSLTLDVLERIEAPTTWMWKLKLHGRY
jgi:hypothetical protein